MKSQKKKEERRERIAKKLHEKKLRAESGFLGFNEWLNQKKLQLEQERWKMVTAAQEAKREETHKAIDKQHKATDAYQSWLRRKIEEAKEKDRK